MSIAISVKHLFRIFTPAVLLLVFALSTLGCEEDVVSVEGSEAPFTMYGVLDPTADTQYVRIFPIEHRLKPTDPIVDVTVSSTDGATGQNQTWQDSLLTFDDGSVGYLFWSPFRAQGDHGYQIRAVRSDQAASSVTVFVPAVLDTVVYDPILNAPVNVTLPVLLKGASPRLPDLEVVYLVRYTGTDSSVARLALPYQDRTTYQNLADGWMVNIELRDDFRLLRQRLLDRMLFDATFGIELVSLTVQTSVTDHAWNPPGGIFSPEVLAEPGVFDNVENGFGFVGAGYRYRTEIPLTESTVVAAGYKPPPPILEPPPPKGTPTPGSPPPLEL